MQDESDNPVKLYSYQDDQPKDGRGILIPPRISARPPVSFTPKSAQVATSKRGTTRVALSVFALVALIVVGTSGYGYIADTNQSASPAVSILSADGQELTRLEYGSTEALSQNSLFLETRDAFIDEGLSFIEVDLGANQLRYFKNGVLLIHEEITSTAHPGSIYELASGLYQVQDKTEEKFNSVGQVDLPWLITFQGNYLIHGQPTYPNGTPAPPDFDLAGITIATEVAERLYDEISTETPILVRKPQAPTPNTFTYEPIAPEVSASSYLVADIENDTILAARELDSQVPIASVVKLMTAVVAAEELSLDTRVRVASPTFVTSLVPRLQQSSTVSMYSLLQLLLIESSNEAAETIAGELGREEFLSAMNQKARQLGMLDTNFADPSGLSADNTSTANDLYTLLKYIAANRAFILNITTNAQTPNPYVGGEFSDLNNFNEVEDMDNFIGGKVGETNAARQTSASLHTVTIDNQTREIAIIILGSEARSEDIEKLLTYITTTYNN